MAWVLLTLLATGLASGHQTAYAIARYERRPYERMRIGGASGLNDEQRAALRALGATEDGDL